MMNLSRIRVSHWIAIFAGLMLLASCSSEKKALKRQRSKERKLNKVGLETFEYEALSIKAKLDLSLNNEDKKARAYIRIRKDSAIWISISKTSIEGLRVLVTPDTIMAIDRINKLFYAYNYQELQEQFKFPFDYQMMQSALTGEPYFPKGSKPSKRPVGDQYMLRDKIGELLVKQFVGKKNHKLEAVQAVDEKERELKIDYGKFEQVEGQAFPHKNRISVNYIQEGEVKETALDFEYNRVSLAEKDLKLPFKVSDKFKQVKE